MAVRKRTYIDFMGHEPMMIDSAQGATGPVVTDAAVNVLKVGSESLVIHNDGANADILPLRLLDANSVDGFQIPCDNTDNDGIEIGQGILSDARAPGAFTIGTDGAFRLDVQMGIPDVSDYDVCAVGFRIAGAYDADIAAPGDLTGGDYTDFACFNVNAGDIFVLDRLNSGTANSTDTTDNWADDDSKKLSVLVSAAGVVTYQIDGSAPTTTAAFTFDTGDVVIPFLRFTKGGTGSDTPPILSTYFCGLQ